MNLNEQQLLRDPSVEPTKEVIADALGAAYDCYLRLLEQLEKININLDWRYYNDGKAWLGKALHHWTTSRGTLKEMTAFWLSAWDGFFRVSVFIPERERAQALAFPFDDRTKNMIKDAKQMGKLKFFPVVFDVRTDGQIDELCKLISFRISLK